MSEEMDKRFDGMDKELDKKFDTKLNPIYQQFKKLDKKIDLIGNVLDSDIVALYKRTARVEDHLQLPRIN